MTLFSERNGYVKPQDILIKEMITPEIRNAICNCYDDLALIAASDYEIMKAALWCSYFNKRKKDYKIYREHFDPTKFILQELVWYKILDLIEKCIKLIQTGMYVEKFISNLNSNFERLHFAYRIVNNLFVEITSDEEIKAIENALENKHDSVKKHLQTALVHLSTKPVGDYRNSIKESISAVEAITREITGENSINFKKMEEAGVLVPTVLREAFLKLYGYSNDGTTGIRHALMDDTNEPTADEAIFMLVFCSAFINYLTKKKYNY